MSVLHFVLALLSGRLRDLPRTVSVGGLWEFEDLTQSCCAKERSPFFFFQKEANYPIPFPSLSFAQDGHGVSTCTHDICTPQQCNSLQQETLAWHIP